MMLVFIENNISSQGSIFDAKEILPLIFVFLGWIFISHQNRIGFLRKEIRDSINEIQNCYLEIRKSTFSFYLNKNSYNELNKQEILNSLELTITKINSITCRSLLHTRNLESAHWKLYETITDNLYFDAKEINEANFDKIQFEKNQLSYDFCFIDSELEAYFENYTRIGVAKRFYLKMKSLITKVRNKIKSKSSPTMK